MANILVIDDDKDILRLLQFALERTGHTVITSVDGLQGLALVEAGKPDLVVADVMMPKMTGYEFCRQVRAKPAFKELPIIIFSARFQPIDKETAREAGATDYLPKSTSPDILVKRIAELLPSPAEPAGARVGTIGLYSLRGGVGATCLAVNLAVTLAMARRVPVALVDLAPLGGHAALMLGLRPAGSVTDTLPLVKNSGTIEALKPRFSQHNSGVFLLPSALMYDQRLSLADPRLPRLLATLKSGFPFTIIDAPHLLEPDLAPVLQGVDRLVLVMSSDMPSVQSAALALQGLVRLGMADDKIVLVVNHVAAQGILPLELIEKTIKRPILADIPFEPEMVKSVNSGKPLVLGWPQSPSSTAIARLAKTFLT